MAEESRAASGLRAATAVPSPESVEAFVQLLMSREGSRPGWRGWDGCCNPNKAGKTSGREKRAPSEVSPCLST